MSIIEVAINAFVIVVGFIVELLMLDDYIKRLVRREVTRLCNECEFKKSKINHDFEQVV